MQATYLWFFRFSLNVFLFFFFINNYALGFFFFFCYIFFAFFLSCILLLLLFAVLINLWYGIRWISGIICQQYSESESLMDAVAGKEQKKMNERTKEREKRWNGKLFWLRISCYPLIIKLLCTSGAYQINPFRSVRLFIYSIFIQNIKVNDIQQCFFPFVKDVCLLSFTLLYVCFFSFLPFSL